MKKDLKARLDKAAVGAAKRMTLAGEKKNPSEATLAEWADDWWHNEGVPTMEHAGAGEREFEDPQYRDAFKEAFKEAMRKRLGR